MCATRLSLTISSNQRTTNKEELIHVEIPISIKKKIIITVFEIVITKQKFSEVKKYFI